MFDTIIHDSTDPSWPLKACCSSLFAVKIADQLDQHVAIEQASFALKHAEHPDQPDHVDQHFALYLTCGLENSQIMLVNQTILTNISPHKTLVKAPEGGTI